MNGFRKCFFALGLVAVAASAQTFVGPMRLVNTPSQPSSCASGSSSAPVISADGRHVAFVSYAKDLVSGQSNSVFLDVFVRDVDAGVTKLVSADVSGVGGGNGNSSYPLISSNGQFVAFISAASNLTAQTGGAVPEIFVRDTVSNLTEMVTVSPLGAAGAGGYATDCDMTPDGRYVAFTSSHTNLTSGTALAFVNLFLRDRLAQTTQLISVQATNSATNSFGVCDAPMLSTNGQRIVFTSTGRDLVVWPGTAPLTANAYLYDQATGTNECLALDAQQVIDGIPQATSNVVISADGSTVAFLAVSNRSFLLYENVDTKMVSIVSSNADMTIAPRISGDGRRVCYRAGTGGVTNIFVWDAQLATNQVVDLALDGTSNGTSIPAGISAGGNRIVFISNATNLTTDVVGGGFQIFVRDMAAGATRVVSAGPSFGNELNAFPQISADGSRVAFASTNGGYVAADYNGASDVFAWTWDSRAMQLVSARDVNMFNAADMLGTILGSVAVSTNGRFVAFASVDGGLVPGDTNGVPDIFVRDMVNGLMADATGDSDLSSQTNATTFLNISSPALSADGLLLAYVENEQVYLRDLVANTRTLVTETNEFQFANASACAISPDGRFVAFQGTDISNASAVNIYVYDAVAGTNAVISGPPFGYNASNPAFSPDSQMLTFQSASPYLTGGNLGTTNIQIYAHYLATGSNEVVSRLLGVGNCSNATFSADSTSVFYSTSQNAVSAIAQHIRAINFDQIVCMNCFSPSVNRDDSQFAYIAAQGGFNQVFVQNTSGTVLHSNLVSVAYNGTSPANGNCWGPLLTPDSRFVVFTSVATNLVIGDTNGHADIFIRDLTLSNTIAITSVGSEMPHFGSVNPVLAADGRTIVFQSFSSDLAPGTLGDKRNLFVVRLGSGDSDHDGMDDDWEMTYFGDLSHDGTADTDGDGMTDLQEFLAGTNPINNDSVLRCLAVSASAGGTTIYWAAVPGRNYRIEYKLSIDDPNWSALVNIATATNATASVVDPDGGLDVQRFYRVVVLP